MRGAAGIARTGSYYGHGSGDIALAFSTAERIPHVPSGGATRRCLVESALDPLFDAAAEATEQAIVDALFAARPSRASPVTRATRCPRSRPTGRRWDERRRRALPRRLRARGGGGPRGRRGRGGTTVEVDAPPGRGFVVATPRVFDPQRWPRALEDAPPVFVRSLFFGSGPHALFADDTPSGRPDRVAPLAALLAAFRRDCRQPGVGPHQRTAAVSASCGSRPPTPTTARSCRALPPARAAARRRAARRRRAGRLEDADAPAALPALHVLFADGAHVFIGASAAPWGSP